MEKDKNQSVNDFLDSLNGDATIESKHDNPFAHLETEEPKEENQEDIVDEPKEEKLPYHKDPKVQRYIQKEIEKFTKNLPKQQIENPNNETKDDLISAFENIIGNDTPEKVRALQMLEKKINDIEEKATSATRQIEAEKQAEKEAEEQLMNGFETIEEEFEVDITSNTPQAKKMKSEFIDFIETIAPKNSNGEIIEYPDFVNTFNLFKQLKTKVSQPTRAKELASRSMTRASDPVNTNQLEDYSWRSIDKIFSKLSD